MNLSDLCVSNLLTLVKACAKARGCQLSTISRLSHGDPPIFDRLASGKGSITVRKYDESMLWLQDPTNWPDGAKIPEIYEPWVTLANGKPKRKRNGKVDGGTS